MSRRAQSSSPSSAEKPPRSKCTTAICFSWKVFTCVISHVTLVSLVVAYCIGGALLFQHLEQDYELEVKKGIRRLRENITDSVWDITDKEIVLVEKNWTQKIEIELERFERQILTAIKTQGWDGEDGEVQTQWTFFGALFYSIIVITTIGYGHIAPRTDWGKVTTIVYAILGIPLMLLCLSSIGDVMAGSFKFLYWRVCCFMCTRETKSSRRQRSLRSSIRHRYSSRSHLPGSPRSFRSSYKYSDSRRAASLEPGLVLAYSGTDLTFDEAEQKYLKGREFYRQINEIPDKNRNIYQVSSRAQQFANRSKNRERFRQSEPERHVTRSARFDSSEDLGFPNRRGQSTRYARSASAGRDISRTRSQTLPMNRGKSQTRSPRLRAKSADPRSQHDEFAGDANKATVYLNTYALDELQKRESHTTKNPRNPSPRSQSMPRQAQFGSRLEPPEMTVPTSKQFRQNHYFEDLEDDGYEMEYLHKERRPRHAGSPKRIAPPSPSMMSPMGMATRRHPQTMLPSDDIYFDEFDSDGNRSREEKQVPIWLCVFLVVSYIVAGAFLFHEWEKWTVLDSAYFCFITLTTIGFGDFVPAQGVKANSKESIALCSLYLLFGISLLAMSFNLVQEEVINNVKELARRLGILKEEDIERSESVESNLNEISYSDSYRPPINRQKVNTRP